MVAALLACAWWLQGRAPRAAKPPAHHGARAFGAILSPWAMGLMMGTLWLGSQWCAARGWPAAWVAAGHLGLMATLPGLLSRPAQVLRTRGQGHEPVTLALLAIGGAVVLVANHPIGGMLGMALQAAAWALGMAAPPAPGTRGASPLWSLGGPVLLLLVGVHSPTAGPQALQWAQALVGLLALVALLSRLRWPGRPVRPLPDPPASSWRSAT
ncbi:MAG: hypothetical protein KAY54_11545 [Burkholderiaceae bacterium]|nr:hypothetical protein [Burkholderiaceae bacterium]